MAQVLQRISKIISATGVCSRREAEKWIVAGRVSINGDAARTTSIVSPGDDVIIDGKPISQLKPVADIINSTTRSVISDTDNAIFPNTSSSAIADQRLSKLISSTGMCSRREAEKWIEAGRVSVNGHAAVIGAVVTSQDKVSVDGMLLQANKTIIAPKLWAVYKISGELVAFDDAKNRPLMFDRLQNLMGPTFKRLNVSTALSTMPMAVADLKPVSRIDYNAEGLCLLTNNGKLARIMESSTMERSYRVRAHGLVNESKLSGLRRGLTVEGIKYKPMAVKIDRTVGTNSWMTIDTAENKAGALKKLFATLYLKPTRIICTGFGPYRLSSLLPEGTDWAEVKLTPELLKLFRQ